MMIKGFLSRFFGNKQARDMRRILPLIDEINQWFEEFEGLSNDELRAKTDEFKKTLPGGRGPWTTFCRGLRRVKQACKRTWGRSGWPRELKFRGNGSLRCAVAGGVSLHEGKISEMATGEGKTLVAGAPLYLNALAAKARTW